MITLALLCEILAGSLKDCEVWTERGYLFIRSEHGTWRLSLDRAR